MFNYLVMVRNADNHLDRGTIQVRELTKKRAFAKVSKSLVNQNKGEKKLELAVFNMNEYLYLRYDEITDSDKFKFI